LAESSSFFILSGFLQFLASGLSCGSLFFIYVEKELHINTYAVDLNAAKWRFIA